jgi:hypothetical protein
LRAVGATTVRGPRDGGLADAGNFRSVESARFVVTGRIVGRFPMSQERQ